MTCDLKPTSFCSSKKQKASSVRETKGQEEMSKNSFKILIFALCCFVMAKGCLRRLRRDQVIFDFTLATQSWLPKAFLQKSIFHSHLLGASY